MANSKKTKCYIYTRVSTAMQVDGYSLDALMKRLRLSKMLLSIFR